jgi:hypothetical protein
MLSLECRAQVTYVNGSKTTEAKTPKNRIIPMNLQVKETSVDLKNDKSCNKNKEMPVLVKKYTKKQPSWYNCCQCCIYQSLDRLFKKGTEICLNGTEW